MKKEIEIPEGYEARIEGNKVILEPKESEDERIRKTLIHIVKGACDKYGIKYRGNEITEEKLLAYLERQKEQKPAEWSEEDKVMLNNIIWSVHMKSIIKPLYEMDDRSRYKKYEDFLKALPERFNLQPKQEWSEEDEKRLKSIIHRIEVQFACNIFGEGKLDVDWLKSLRPQPHWKPSEEKMVALDAAISYLEESDNEDYEILNSLYEDLKKL